MLPAGTRAQINAASWQRPALFAAIAEAGVEEVEMQRTFNLGLGLVLAVAPANVAAVSER
jgi:phosphoribosylformylglycinamidine cyclo-ligase